MCVYSLRAEPTPYRVDAGHLRDEVEKALHGKSADPLRFDAEEVLRRVEKFGDLFAPVATLKQALPAAEPSTETAPNAPKKRTRRVLPSGSAEGATTLGIPDRATALLPPLAHGTESAAPDWHTAWPHALCQPLRTIRQYQKVTLTCHEGLSQIECGFVATRGVSRKACVGARRRG